MPTNVRIQPMMIPEGNPERMDQPVLGWPYPGMIGGLMTVEDRNDPRRSKTFQMVKTDSTMTVSPFRGAVAWWQDKTNYVVTTSPTALGRGQVAGVFTFANVKGNITLIQTKGKMPVVKFVDAPTAVPTAAGLFVIPSATAAKADCLAAGTAATFPVLGRSDGAYNAADATASVDLDVPEVL